MGFFFTTKQQTLQLYMTCLLTVCSYVFFKSINLYVNVHMCVKNLRRLLQNRNIFLQIKQNNICFTFEFSTMSLFHYEQIKFILISFRKKKQFSLAFEIFCYLIKSEL